jgi:tetratricopeptide (TPR) repeat protein
VLATFRDKLAKSETQKVEELAKRLGLKDLSTSVRSLHEVLQEAETEAGRAQVLRRALTAKLGQPLWLLAIVVVLIAVPAGVVLVKDVLAWLLNASWIARINEGVLALSSMIAGASVLIGNAVRSAKGALDELEQFRKRFDDAVKARTEEEKKKSAEAAGLAASEREVARLKNELEQAERKFAEADRRSDDAMRDYENATARGRLNAFIRDKLASGDYAKHLGLIATIRKDFQQLAQLMAEVDEEKEAREDYRRALEEYKKRLEELLAAAKNDGVLSEEETARLRSKTAPPEARLFTRIILYIDDLDRCPPDKVVDVLQAIHLLLYFPLFVVVVAVDARWVSRSLRDQFPELLAENIISARRVSRDRDMPHQGVSDARAGPLHTELPAAATSHDYLEKIFQIPYWVRSMDRDASMKYVKGLAELDRRAEARRATAEKPVVPVASTRAAGGAPAAQAAPSAEPRAQPPATPSASPAQAQEEATPQPAYVARGMTILQVERDFLEAMAPYVGGTPRRGLRFFNIYRLVKTSLPESWQGELVDEGGRKLGFRALLTQLAIVTGAPHVSWSYFELLSGAVASIRRSVSEPSAPKGGQQEIRTLAELRKRVEGELSAMAGGQKQALLGALERLEVLNEKAKLDTGEAMLVELQRFAPIARRYSFTARPH